MIPRTHLFVVLLTLLAGSLLGVAVYPHLPPRVPIHWNLRGQADGFGPRWVDAILLPSINWLLMLVLLLVPRLKHSRPNFPRFAKTYGRILVTIALSLLIIHSVVLFRAAGRPFPVARLLPAVAGLLIAFLGNWMGKIRRNGFVGIRTPWTLASDYVWERTHRAGAKIMVLFGLSLSVAAFLAPPLVTAIYTIAGALLLGAWAMVYSYRLSRHATTNQQEYR